MTGNSNKWHVYLVRTGGGQLYTGIATDVERRVEEHKSCNGREAKYLRGRGPLEVVYRCELGDRGLALQVEHSIKRRPKEDKEALVARRPRRRDLLRSLGISKES